MILFRDDDEGFNEWLWNNISEGFVVCSTRIPKVGKTVLHTTGCQHARHYNGRNSTGGKNQRLVSLCANELYFWAEEQSVALEPVMYLLLL